MYDFLGFSGVIEWDDRLLHYQVKRVAEVIYLTRLVCTCIWSLTLYPVVVNIA